jgi:streptogramin lyase
MPTLNSVSDPATKSAKYFAFLSYSRADEKAAARLSRYLETFRVPVRLGGPEQRLPKRMAPIFRDREEFSASSDLGTTITDALASSRSLIVLCSPAAAKSVWVNQEITTFRRLGDSGKILAVLLEGDPRESFPPALTEGGVEPLATDFRPSAHDRANSRLRLVAGLLGIDFDALKRRERLRVRKLRLQVAAITLLVILMVGLGIGFGLMNARDADRQRHLALALTFASHIREFAAPISRESAITASADGLVWFTEADTPRIAQIASDGVISETRIPGADGFGGLASGTNGTVWVGDGLNKSIDRISTDGSIAKYSTGEYLPGPLAVGPDGAIWFAEESRNKIGRMSLGRTAADRKITEFSIPTQSSYPKGIAIAPDGTFWFTETGGLGRIAKGNLTELHLPMGRSATGITVGPDRAVWFTEDDGIGRVTADGAIHEIETPTHDSGPSGIAIGPDGNLWFAESAANKLGRISPNGEILEIALSTPLSAPKDLVAGPNGTLWFTEPGSAKIGVIQVTPRKNVAIVFACSTSDCGAGGMGLDLTRPQDLRVARVYENCLNKSDADSQADLTKRCGQEAGVAAIDVVTTYKGPMVYIVTGKPGHPGTSGGP